MKIKPFILKIILFTLIGCTDRLSICEKYLQKEYIDSNLRHEKLFDGGKTEEAISIVEEIIYKDSNNFVAINYLGAYKYSLCQKDKCSLEQRKEVYDLYKKSIELCPKYRVGYFNTIEVLADMSKTEYENDPEIIEYLEFYNSKWKKRSNLLTKGGQAMFRLGRIDKAMEYLNEAVKLDSTEAMAYIFKGKCYTSQKDWSKAMEYLNIGLGLDSISLGFHERGYVNNKLGNTNEAIKDYNTAISLYDDRWESYVGLGVIEVNRNNIYLACQYFFKAKGLEGANEMVDRWIVDYCQNE